MKKLLILSLLLGVGLCAGANDIPMPVGNLINDIGNMQNPNSQLKLLEEQKFRQEEYNEFKDMKEVKAKRNKQLELEQEAKQQVRTYNDDVQFIQENGRLMLKRID